MLQNNFLSQQQMMSNMQPTHKPMTLKFKNVHTKVIQILIQYD